MAGTKNRIASTGEATARPPSRSSEVGPTEPLDETGDEEERGLDRDVVHDVEDRAGGARLRGERDAEDHVADVADQREGQHSLEPRCETAPRMPTTIVRSAPTAAGR